MCFYVDTRNNRSFMLSKRLKCFKYKINNDKIFKTNSNYYKNLDMLILSVIKTLSLIKMVIYVSLWFIAKWETCIIESNKPNKKGKALLKLKY